MKDKEESKVGYYRYYFQCHCGKCFWSYEELMKHQVKEHKLKNGLSKTERFFTLK